MGFWFRTTKNYYGYILDPRSSSPERGQGLTLHTAALEGEGSLLRVSREPLEAVRPKALRNRMLKILERF